MKIIIEIIFLILPIALILLANIYKSIKIKNIFIFFGGIFLLICWLDFYYNSTPSSILSENNALTGVGMAVVYKIYLIYNYIIVFFMLFTLINISRKNKTNKFTWFNYCLTFFLFFIPYFIKILIEYIW